jgi:hypothetical protein
VHCGVEEITVNARKMLKKFYWTYLLIRRSLKVAFNRSIILKYAAAQKIPDTFLNLKYLIYFLRKFKSSNQLTNALAGFLKKQHQH